MPRKKRNTSVADLKAVLSEDADPLRPLVQGLVQEVVQAEIAECLNGPKGERRTAPTVNRNPP